MSNVLYKQVIEQILKKVHSGEIRVGDRLPPEAEYAEHLGVSRSTLRMAFSHLEKSGVLQRRKRGGTRVIADTPGKQFSMVTNGIHDVLSLGRDTLLEISSIDQVHADDISVLQSLAAELLQPAGDGRWLEITGTRSLEGQAKPFNWSQIHVCPNYADIEKELGQRVPSVFQVVETKYQVAVARVRQAVHAVACPAQAAKLIGLSPGAPALKIQAQLEDSSGQLIEVSTAIFDPDRFQVSTDVQVSS